ncbi:MAG: efflux RND transporter periplasmic adaptor subunit, partial [Pyrinomonadaceae bacterium]
MNPCSRVKLLVLISAVGLSLPLSIASGRVSHVKTIGKRTTGQTRPGATRSIIVGSGEVRRSGFIQVKGEVAGRIHQIHVQPGDEIAKGQPLLVIEPQSNAQNKVTLYSPLKGIVADVSTRVGEAAQSETTLMTLADMSRIYVEINIDGSDISRVAVGQRSKIVVDAFPEAPIFGGVVLKDPTPVSQSGEPE